MTVWDENINPLQPTALFTLVEYEDGYYYDQLHTQSGVVPLPAPRVPLLLTRPLVLEEELPPPPGVDGPAARCSVLALPDERPQAPEEVFLEIGGIALHRAQQIFGENRFKGLAGEKARVRPVAEQRPVLRPDG